MDELDMSRDGIKHRNIRDFLLAEEWNWNVLLSPEDMQKFFQCWEWKNNGAWHNKYYDMSVFNRCIETGNVLLILECWQDVHPALVSIPVKWEYSSPYGLLYALNPPDDVMQFENNGAWHNKYCINVNAVVVHVVFCVNGIHVVSPLNQ